MKKALIFTSIILLNLNFQLSGQTKEPFLTIEKDVYDLGKIKESDGIAICKLEITNNGQSPLIIHGIKTTSSSVSSTFSREPVLPGEKTVIEIGYNPEKRPGPFQRKVIILSNALNNQVAIEIKGDVISTAYEKINNPQTLQDKYKEEIGSILVSTKHVAFQKIYLNDVDTMYLQIYNPTAQELNITLKNVPAHINTMVEPDILKPNTGGTIRIIFDAKKKNDWGFVFDRINILINNEFKNANYFSVSADIVENFENLTPGQRANAPVINFYENNYNFDTISQDTVVLHKFNFNNSGKSDLIIRKVKTSCGCTASNAGSNVIKAGEESYILVRFSSGKRSGKQSKTVTVITNDPKTPSSYLRFKCVVVPKQ